MNIGKNTLVILLVPIEQKQYFHKTQNRTQWRLYHREKGDKDIETAPG